MFYKHFACKLLICDYFCRNEMHRVHISGLLIAFWFCFVVDMKNAVVRMMDEVKGDDSDDRGDEEDEDAHITKGDQEEGEGTNDEDDEEEEEGDEEEEMEQFM